MDLRETGKWRYDEELIAPAYDLKTEFFLTLSNPAAKPTIEETFCSLLQI